MLSDLTLPLRRDGSRARLDFSSIVLWPGLVAYALAIGLGARLFADPDTFLHVAAGQWILAHGSVPTADPFSATRAGAPWTAHEWLAELLFAKAYGLAGWAGVATLTALAMAASFSILAGALSRSLPARGVVAVLALAFLLLAPHLTARPHILAMPFMIAWTAGLARARSESRAPSLWLLPLLFFWANLHGSFPLAIALAAAFGAEAVIAEPRRQERLFQARGWAGFLLLAALVPLISPIGLSAWQFSFMLMRMKYALSLVGEWQAADFSRFQPLEIWLLALLAMGLSGVIRVRPIRLLILLGFIHLALSHARFSDQLAMLGPLVIADSLSPLFARGPAGARSGRMSGFEIAFALIVAAGLSAAGLVRPLTNDDPKIAPVRAVANLGQGIVFNDYNFGDYLIFRGRPAFVDGRLDLYGDDFMRDYMAALDGNPDALQRLIERYRVQWALLKPEAPATLVLEQVYRWRPLYADSQAVVLVNDRHFE